MHYRKFPPQSSLASFVECYFVWQGDAETAMTVQSPPNGYCALVLNLGDPYTASQHSNDQSPVPKAFVSGQFTANYQLHLRGNINIVGIVLKPAALHNCYGIRMSQLVNSRADLGFLQDPNADALVDQVRNCSSEDSVKLFESFMLALLQKGKSNLSIIDEAIERIDNVKGCVTVEHLATQLKVSRRYLEKKFLEKVGVSPKFYSRIRRFGALSNVIAHTKDIDWQQIVMDYGFHDQSHLVKEFMEFNQMNPTQYHLLHRELTRFIKG